MSSRADNASEATSNCRDGPESLSSNVRSSGWSYMRSSRMVMPCVFSAAVTVLSDVPGRARMVAPATRRARRTHRSRPPNPARTNVTRRVAPTPSIKSPAPSVMPMAATTQIVAADVRPMTVPCACMIVPAPRNPSPVTICAAMRDVSPMRCPSTMPIRTERSMSNAGPTQMRMLVRSPAGLPASSRSKPTVPPMRAASKSLTRRSMRSVRTTSIIWGDGVRCCAAGSRMASSRPPPAQSRPRSRTSSRVVSGELSPYAMLRACASSASIAASSGSVGVANVRNTVPAHWSQDSVAGTSCVKNRSLPQVRHTSVTTPFGPFRLMAHSTREHGIDARPMRNDIRMMIGEFTVPNMRPPAVLRQRGCPLAWIRPADGIIAQALRGEKRAPKTRDDEALASVPRHGMRVVQTGDADDERLDHEIEQRNVIDVQPDEWREADDRLEPRDEVQGPVRQPRQRHHQGPTSGDERAIQDRGEGCSDHDGGYGMRERRNAGSRVRHHQHGLDPVRSVARKREREDRYVGSSRPDGERDGGVAYVHVNANGAAVDPPRPGTWRAAQASTQCDTTRASSDCHAETE